jgi:hypothetical protein
MKRSVLSLTLGLFAAVALAPASLTAQNDTDSDQITATAEVAIAINVARVADLDFGTVMPGWNRVIAVDDPTAGHFQVTGGASAEVALNFSILPTDLQYDDGVTIHLLPVTFTALHNTAADPTGGTSFDPTVGEPGTNLDAGTGELHVYVGGTVTADPAQVAGTYTAQVELTAAYTGN